MHEGRRVPTTSSSPMRAVANHQMDSTSLTFDRFVSMSCSPDPGPSTSATFVCTSASGACVIVTNTSSPRMSRPPPSRLRRPHGLCAFVQKPLVADAVVQQADLQRWVDANRIDPPQMRKCEDGNCSVGYLGSAICVFFVFWCFYGMMLGERCCGCGAARTGKKFI